MSIVLDFLSGLFSPEGFVQRRLFGRWPDWLVDPDRGRLATIVESSNDAIVGKDLDGVVNFWNAGAERLFGYTAAEALGRPITFLMPPDRLGEEVDLLAQLRRGERVDHFESIRVAKNGLSIDVSLTISPIKDRSGRVVGISKIARDITERKLAEEALRRTAELKRSEEALRRSEERLRSVVDHVIDGIIAIDEQGIVQTLNPAAERIFGYPAADIIGKNVNILMPEPFHSEHDSHVAKCLLAGRPTVVGINREAKGRRNDGSSFPMDLAVSEFWLGDRRFFTGIIRDITERKEAEEALRRSEETFRGMVQAANEGIWILDEHARIEFVNPRMVEMLGYEPHELVGRLKWDFLFEENREEIAARFERRRSGHREQCDVRFRCRDGRILWTLMAGGPLRAEDGTFRGVMDLFTDITERKDAELQVQRLNENLELRVSERTAELSAARDAAEDAGRAKSTFLANMSHEIRTPMNGVIGMTGLLMTTELSPEQREFVETIRGSGNALLGLLNDILDYSKFESGRLDLESAPFNLRRLAEEAAEMMAPSAFAKGIEVVTSTQPEMHEWYNGDAGRLRQVLINYLGNAIKFTAEGGEIVLEVSARPPAAGIAHVRMAVRDNGIGVPAGRQAAIFDRFTQADESTSRKYGGTGLGLAICRSLALIMKGVVGMESEPGRGSTFWLELDLPSADEPHSGSATTATLPRAFEASALRDRLVLVAVGNATFRTVLSKQLRSWGLRTVEAAEAADVFSMLRSADAADPVAAALFDERLPRSDPSELAKALAADSQAALIPRVLLRAGGVASSDEGGRSGLFAAVLTKPVRQSALFDTLVSLVCGGAALGPERPEAAAAAPPRFDGTRVLVVEDNATNQKVALRMLGHFGCVSDAVGSGLEALDLLGRVPYDLVLMDINMPGMDGLEATSELRRREARTGAGRRLPVIAMTASAMPGDRDRCLAAGMDDYLAKPVALDALSGLLSRWRGGSPHPQGEPIAVGVTELVSFRPERLVEITGGDPALEQELLECFLSDAERLLGQLALAVNQRDPVALRKGAHELSGMCQTLGVPALGASARGMEEAALRNDLRPLGAALDRASRQFDEVRVVLLHRLGR
jgi:two-component system sensor histidine kinase/response regulator